MKNNLMICCIAVAILFGPSISTAATKTSANEVKTALLLIDIQQFYFTGGGLPLHHPRRASLNAKRLIDKFRQERGLIIHVGHVAKSGAGFHPDVAPKPGEPVVMKKEVSAFNGTDLLKLLKDRGIKRLVICGMQTHMCIEAAVRAAHDLGFECVVIHDACATRSLTFQGRTISAQDVHAATLSTLNKTYAEVLDTEAFLRKH
ncbi:MAG: cysteine hydrolase family protein [Myxococcota bacterium]|nr:cysteine hydrolase family protein [Myxococcota bacterium]